MSSLGRRVVWPGGRGMLVGLVTSGEGCVRVVGWVWELAGFVEDVFGAVVLGGVVNSW